MAFIVADRVQETATANTTVSFTLTGAITSYQSFSAIGNTNTTYYGATDGTNWEVGLGTYSTTGPTLTRTTILSSSNSGSAVTFSGAVTVWCDYPAGKQISSDYPNALGVVTPAAGTFTTITGQTEVLKGTGQNFLTYSQTFQNAAWIKQTNVTATDNTTVAPDATTTAATIAWGSASNGTGIYNQVLSLSLTGISNTKSIYVRADVAGGTVDLVDPTLTAGVTTATLTTSWQRITLTESAQTTGIGVWIKKTASSPSTIYLWGGQAEIGSTANTYIPTTTTAIYGTPTLSFSGVAGLGLQSNGSLYVSPAGTGALQAQATTSSTVGGNARGANAVDFQMVRATANQVAQGTTSVIVGGQNNAAGNTNSSIVGGNGNTISGGSGGFIGGGTSNVVSGYQGAIVGGNSNGSSTQFGVYNFIGGGSFNTGTASAAVTTQATTSVTSGSTAVTLSASNASIKVGQYVSGTGIGNDNYVAAISGTSLTLSKNASATGTPTLSFSTPHGVVVGGGNNQATGSYSFIGGGGDAGTAGNRNVASGDWSFVGGGIKNTASGAGSVVGGGGWDGGNISANTASGAASVTCGGWANSNSGGYAVIAGGYSNTASNSGASVIGGYQNTANGAVSSVLSGRLGTTRSISGNTIFAASNVPVGGGGLGYSQAGLLILGRATTDATATVLTSDSSAASGTNQVILPNNSAYYFTGEIISGVTGGGNSKGWEISGLIKRGANAGATTLVGSTVTSLYGDAGAATWTIGLTADTTNGGLTVTFTGQASTTIRTVCQIRTTEMTY